MCVQDKVQAARALVAKLRSLHGALVRSTERLCEAYIELAYHDSSVDRPKGTQGETFGYECTYIMSVICIEEGPGSGRNVWRSSQISHWLV